MTLLSQPFNGQLGNRIIEMLDSGRYQTFNMIVAFAKNSGVLRLQEAITNFRKNGGEVHAYVGVDLGGTSYEALTNLMHCTDSLYVVHSAFGQTFHPKIYNFVSKEDVVIIVGSHNLTAGGLWTNFESSLAIRSELSGEIGGGTQSQMEELLNTLRSLGDSVIQLETQSQIESLLEFGYVQKEIAQQIATTGQSKQAGAASRVFGGVTRAKLPELNAGEDKSEKTVVPISISTSSLSHTEPGSTIWFETRALTGGSRNILDLSKKSLVEIGDPSGTPFDLGEPGFMRGAVEFFGLDPSDTKKVKDIRINYEGTDYDGNSILFPKGEHANGTWRLQIKGSDSSGRKITDALTAKGGQHFLKHKVLAFGKVSNDYFFMSVFPESEMENFRAASVIVARNGSNRQSKLLGVLEAAEPLFVFGNSLS